MKVISIKKENILFFAYVLIIIAAIAKLLSKEAVETFYMPVSKKTIVIDAGHGGWDPGKVSDKNILEKDINLEIAKKLQSFLEQGGSNVFVTRSTDEALGQSKKVDMKNRVYIANESKSEIFISIHQNSFPNNSVEGAQVFYFDNSSDSGKLAEKIQSELNSIINKQSKESKPNEVYYLLKKTKTPAVIVECGFLSNSNDLNKLTDDEYQEKVAWAIYKGIIDYFYEIDEI